MSFSQSKNKKALIIVGLIFLFAFDFFLWSFIFQTPKFVEANFLDVGQGDATLFKFPMSGQILIDSGDGVKIKNALANVEGFFDRQIDVWILTHANLDHYGGFLRLIETNPPRLFIYNGFDADNQSFKELKSKLEESHIPILVLKAGDKIKVGENQFLVLWPKSNFESKDLNDSGLIFKIQNLYGKMLMLADVSTKITNNLSDLKADILKVGHHGSKTATNEKLLNLIQPKIALIGVGLNNRFGHPHQEVIGLLTKIGSQIFRTDLLGTIKIIFDNQLEAHPLNH
jgi:competence protein ComEC